MGTIKQRTKAAPEISYDSATGDDSFQAFSDVLLQNPSIIIFDNQSDEAVAISDDGTETWKTFAAGQALAVDLRANKAYPAEDYSWPIGTQFYASSAAGTGNFYISYLYAQ